MEEGEFFKREFLHLTSRLFCDKQTRMDSKLSSNDIECAFAEFAKRFPVARGCLTATHSPCTRKNCKRCAQGLGHPKLIFTYHENGKLKGLYVRPEHEAAVRQAIENGRAVERMMAAAGRELILSLRKGGDAD